MNKINNKTFIMTILMSVCFSANADNSSANGDLRLRYESVSQDNDKKAAQALTLRTRLTLTSSFDNNISALVEFEDSRTVLGLDDYNNTNGQHTEYSVIADPETTELDQAFVKYQTPALTIQAGRQVLTFDNHRFVGHVGWRQDRQTFDGVTFAYQVNKKFTLNYGYLQQRNRIFGQQKDLDSKDHLFNLAYLSGYGKLTAYGYLLAVDNHTNNSLDTYGMRFAGKRDNYLYSAEYAYQSSNNENSDFSANYMLIEGGYQLEKLTAKIGVELLGSDNGNYGFSTPLATLHKFNGWSDQFLTTPKQGLKDLYMTLSGKVFSGKWTLSYHDFSAQHDTDTIDDFGNEIDVLFTKSFANSFSAGVKVARYSAGDSFTGKVDTDKVWFWLATKF